ncbi:MAG: hypothetical protein NVSMB70_01040 [Chamaesiphon sp.]
MTSAKANPIPERKNDWAWAQAQYEQTESAVTDIAVWIGVKATAVAARASTHGWVRNKKEKVVESMGRVLVEASNINRNLIEELKQQKTEIAERVTQLMQAKVLSAQRADIHRVRTLISKLFAQLEIAGPEDEEATFLEELEARTKVAEKLVAALTKAVALERQAYGIVNVLEEAAPERQVATPDADIVNKVLAKFASVAKRVSADSNTVIDIP